MTMKTMQELVNEATEKMREIEALPKKIEEPSAAELEAAALKMTNAGYYPKDQEAWKALCRWLALKDAGRQSRGLWIEGPAGCGKTMFVGRCVQSTFNTCSGIVSSWKEQECNVSDGLWNDPLLKSVNGRDYEYETCVAFDDLGVESTAVNFGQRCEVMSEVIAMRYLRWQSSKELTLITTNLTPEQVDARYGRRATDRMREMCLYVKINCGSNR